MEYCPLWFIFAFMKTYAGTIIRSAILLIIVVMGYACNHESPLPETIAENSELPRIVVNNKEFHVETFGSPINPTVIVVHGGPGWDYSYLMPLAGLSDKYYVVFYDQSGCGLSPRYDADELTLANALEDLHGMVVHFGNNRRVNLIGHGYGAMLASAYLGQHPDRVAYTVLAEPPFLTAENKNDSLPPLLDISPLLESKSKEFSVKRHDKEDRKMLSALKAKDHIMSQYSCNKESYRGLLLRRPGALASYELLGKFYTTEEGNTIDFTVGNQRFKNTVLLLYGGCNKYFTAEDKKARQDAFRHAITKTVPDAGHFIFTDNPSTSLTFIRGYFNNTNMIRSNKTFSF